MLDGYRPQPGVYDEMVDETGAVRPHWAGFVDRLAAEAPGALQQRFGAADRYLKESGVFYRVYDDPAAGERPWPLSHVPLLISSEDWVAIEAGVIQRARLIEAFLADAYSGGERLARLGVPAALMAGSPDFLRPLVQAGRPAPRQLHFYAVDLCRSPSGQWQVLRDRTQAPSGAGFALENRIALSRALSDVVRAFDVQRLAPFFDALRAELARQRAVDDAGVCLLTPGPLNETYFEHSYLARYLGFRLVEGMDLMVLGGEVHLRTVGGLRKVSVLLRRIDGDFADPLELNARSKLGVPGLARVARRGTVTLANALGSGLAEARALLGALPALAEPLIGERLALPNVATWWCGDEAQRAAVLDAFGALVIAPAFARDGGVPPGGPWVTADLDDARRAQLRAAIARRGVDFVGQEAATLSTTPVWRDGRLEPQPFVFRVFVAATADGYTVMPGGFALIGPQHDQSAVSMQRGARSADVWVMSDGPVPQTTLLPSEMEIVVRRGEGVLPSRAADNLFWLARYVERAEATLRLIRGYCARASEDRAQGSAAVAALAEMLFRWGAADHPAVPGEAGLFAQAALAQSDLDGSVSALVAAARRAGLGIRDRFPPDAWRALEDLQAHVDAAVDRETADVAVFERSRQALRTIAAVTGFQLETMNRVAGWRFFKLGFRIERGLATCRFARQFARREGGSREELDLLLELNDCQITYRSRYPFGAAFAPVMDLVLLDESNPRSLAFQLAQLKVHTQALPVLPPERRRTPAVVVADRLHALVSGFDPAKIESEDILGIENALMHLSDEISFSFFRVRDPHVADGGSP
ncbi:MAG: circularly permuted type 2 ATP-grasp protein [Hyphomicrobium sp.]|nr:circularly permuted type 2 ATP-grasp protein [Hyphomicrobium sp.]